MLNLIPLSDANPTRRLPLITIALIVLNVVVFLQEPGFGQGEAAGAYFYEYAPVPCQLLEGRCPESVPLPGGAVPLEDPGLLAFTWKMLFSTFLHGGFLHLGGNILFLWVFGNNVEDWLGRVKFTLFYLIGGVFASLAHVLWSLKDLPASLSEVTSLAPFVPSVGASGAVAAVMGAYLLLFPRARIKTLFMVFLITIVELSAFAVLAMWFVYQFLIATRELAGAANEVAWMAHVGGFVFGLAAIFLLGGRPQPRKQAWQAPQWRY